MKKNKFQDQFLAELVRIPIVQIACDKTGLSRNTVYRWKKEDKEFAKKMDDAIKEGVALVNDLSESQLLMLIKEKNYSAISFWLRHRNDNYKNKLEVTTKDIPEELTPSQTKAVKKALALAQVIQERAFTDADINNEITTQ
jgi:hypothetical protein